MINEFDKIVNRYEIKEDVGLIRILWEKYISSYDENKLFYLDKDFLISSCEYLNFQDDWVVETVKNAESINANELFKKFSWVCHNILVNEEFNRKSFDLLKKIDDYTRKDFSFFHAIVLLSGLDFIKKQYKEKGIAEKIMLDTLSCVNIWIRRDSIRAGKLEYKHIHWHAQHFHLKLFKIGRLQYQFSKFNFNNYCFKNKNNNFVVLSEANIKYRQDGQFDGANNISDDNGWFSTYNESQTHFVGNPISPFGRVINRTLELNKNEWNLEVKQGDNVLALHIPASGSLNILSCNESFKNAVDFFKKYYPEFNYSVFTCGSWLLDNQYSEYLSQNSNIRKFAEEFYLFPLKNADDRGTFGNVFGSKKNIFDNLPQSSSLQKSMVGFLKSGRNFRSGGGFVFKNRFDFGAGIYRKFWNDKFKSNFGS